MGLANAAIDAVWPTWWSAEADSSASARAELRFGIARRLGLDPNSLLDDHHEPRFLWREEARYKHLTAEDQIERAGIESFGHAVASAISGAITPATGDLNGRAADDLRSVILANGSPFVGLGELLALCWGVGIPVVHLRVFPWPQKRMAAMTVRLAQRSFILLGKDASYPAPIAFYLAHELGHIALAHIEADQALVDMDAGDPVATASGDDEELAADAYALELLTGRAQPVVLPADPATKSAGELARTAISAGAELNIEPGTLALCFGYSTGDWRTANASMKMIYDAPRPVWEAVNAIAVQHLPLSDAPSDSADFLKIVLGRTTGD